MIHPVHGLNHHFDQVLNKRTGSLTEKKDRRSTFTRDIDQPKIEWMKFVQRFLVAMSMDDRQRYARTLVWNDEVNKFDTVSGLPSFMTFPTCQTSVNNLAPQTIESGSGDDAESIIAASEPEEEEEENELPLESIMVKEEEMMDANENSVNEISSSSLTSDSFESFASFEKSSPEPIVKVEPELTLRVKIEPEVLNQLRMKLEEMINYPSTTIAATIPTVASELTRSLSEEEDDAGTVCEMDEEMESPHLSSPIMSLDELPPLESPFTQWLDDDEYMSRQRSRPEYERM